MTVGELKKLLATSSLPDSAEVFLSGRHSLHVCQAEETDVSDINQYGQAQHRLYGRPALLIQDASKG